MSKNEFAGVADDAELVWLTDSGVVWSEGSVEPAAFKAYAIPAGDFTRDDTFCSPCSAQQQELNNANLQNSVFYMVQSIAGRVAAKTISDRHVRIGYDDSFAQRGVPQSGFRNGIPYILVPPNLDPVVQHIVLIQQAAQFAISDQYYVKASTPLTAQAKQVVAQAATYCGTIAIMDHCQEWIAASEADPARFMPGDLPEKFRLILTLKDIVDLQVPLDPQARSVFKNAIIAMTEKSCRPEALLRDGLGAAPVKGVSRACENS